MSDFLERLKESEKSAPGRQARSGQRVVSDIMPPPRRQHSIPSLREEKRRPETLPQTPPHGSKITIAKLPTEEHVRSASPARSELPPPLKEETFPEPELPIRSWEPKAVHRARIRRRIILWFAVALAGFGLVLPTFAFPKFSITITPKIKSFPIPQTEFILDTALSAPKIAERRLPALEITVDTTFERQYEASGKKFIQERARGTVTIFNAFSSQAQSLVANTRLQDASGKVYRLVASVTLPGAKIVDGKIVPTTLKAEVVADGAGPDYNIGPTELRIPGFRGTAKYEGFYARSEKPFDGGFTGEARIVLADDIKKSTEDATRQAIEELRVELQKKMPVDPDIFVPDGARETVVVKVVSPRPGDRFDRFPVTVLSRGRLAAIRRSQASEAIGALFLPTNGLPARVAKAQPELEIRSSNLGGNASPLKLTFAGKIAYWREPDANDLKSTLSASTPAKVEAYLRGRDEIGAFRIKRFPPWLWFVPNRGDGLSIKVEPPT